MKCMILGLSFLALAAQPQGVLAQEARFGPGSDVRLLASPSRDIRGELVSWDADSIRIQEPASGLVHSVPSLGIERLRVSEPRPRGRGALRGLLVGSIVGALSMGTIAAASPCEGFCFSPGQVFLLGAGVGGAMGGGAGAAIGAGWPGTRWVEVSPRLSEDGRTSSRALHPSPRSDR